MDFCTDEFIHKRIILKDEGRIFIIEVKYYMVLLMEFLPSSGRQY